MAREMSRGHSVIGPDLVSNTLASNTARGTFTSSMVPHLIFIFIGHAIRDGPSLAPIPSDRRRYCDLR